MIFFKDKLKRKVRHLLCDGWNTSYVSNNSQSIMLIGSSKSLLRRSSIHASDEVSTN